MSTLVDQNCLFCKVVKSEIPASIVERTSDYVAFADISPQAPHHILIVPTQHIAAISHQRDALSLGVLVAAAARIGAQVGGASGFRLVINEGTDGGQTVHHLHIHVIAGRAMKWPPG